MEISDITPITTVQNEQEEEMINRIGSRNIATESAATNSFLEFSPRSSHVGGEETEFDGILSSRLRIIGVT